MHEPRHQNLHVTTMDVDKIGKDEQVGWYALASIFMRGQRHTLSCICQAIAAGISKAPSGVKVQARIAYAPTKTHVRPCLAFIRLVNPGTGCSFLTQSSYILQDAACIFSTAHKPFAYRPLNTTADCVIAWRTSAFTVLHDSQTSQLKCSLCLWQGQRANQATGQRPDPPSGSAAGLPSQGRIWSQAEGASGDHGPARASPQGARQGCRPTWSCPPRPRGILCAVMPALMHEPCIGHVLACHSRDQMTECCTAQASFFDMQGHDGRMQAGSLLLLLLPCKPFEVQAVLRGPICCSS